MNTGPTSFPEQSRDKRSSGPTSVAFVINRSALFPLLAMDTIKRFKLVYFQFWCGQAVIQPFLPVFYQSLGMDGKQIGTLSAIQPLISIIAAPVLGAIADSSGHRKLTFMVCLALAVTSRFVLQFIGPNFGILFLMTLIGESLASPLTAIIDSASLSYLQQHTKSTEGYGKQRLWGAVGWGLCGQIVLLPRALCRVLIRPCGVAAASGGLSQMLSIRSIFFSHVVLMALAAIPIYFLPFDIDREARARSSSQSETFSALTDKLSGVPEDNGEHDGQPMQPIEHNAQMDQEMTVISPGSAVAALSGGVEIETSDESKSSLLSSRSNSESQSAQFLAETQEPAQAHEPDAQTPANSDGIAMPAKHSPDRAVPDTPTLLLVDSDHPKANGTVADSDAARSPAKLGFCRSCATVVCLIFANAETLAFFVVVLLLGSLYGILSSFLFLYIRSLGGSELVMGLSLTVTCVAEVPVFQFSGLILRKCGLMGTLCLSLFCYAIRFLLYSILNNPWAVLPIELLHGYAAPCFSFDDNLPADSPMRLRGQRLLQRPIKSRLQVLFSPQRHCGQRPFAGLGSATQGLLQAVHWGLGLGGGSIIGTVSACHRNQFPLT